MTSYPDPRRYGGDRLPEPVVIGSDYSIRPMPGQLALFGNCESPHWHPIDLDEQVNTDA